MKNTNKNLDILYVKDTQCKNCLFTKNKLVSDKRRKKILTECERTGQYFICHEATLAGNKTVCCKAFYRKYKNKMAVIILGDKLGVTKFIDNADFRDL